MAKILIGLSVLFLTLSAVLGVLNNSKARGLRDSAEQMNTELREAEQVRLAQEKEIASREKALAEARATAKEVENRVAIAEADLVRNQTERGELQGRLAEHETEIADLRRRLEEATAAASQEIMPDQLPMPGAGDLAQQLEDTRRQLDAAERERAMLADRIRATEEREQAPQRRRAAAAPGIRGTVMAVNQSYNFVVLNLGSRQGLEPNTEMLIMRGATPIGRVRITSVEPATAIGDIITSTLARGVQVQPGDNVIYAGAQ
jgi:septal ring factor EnvC (AmiA/AmiB activator)